MAWTNIDNALVSVGALPFATTIQALRDNPIAIANGDAGAPRVQAAALDTGTDERDWVLARNSGATVGVIGSYAFLSYPLDVSTQDTLLEGATIAGPSLRYSGASENSIGSAPAGTWRAMGRTRTLRSGSGGDDPFQYFYFGTVFLRIS